MPGLEFWREITGAAKPHNADNLVEALRKKNIDWLAYPNMQEGAARKVNMPYPQTSNDAPVKSFEELLVSNPSITILNPKAYKDL